MDVEVSDQTAKVVEVVGDVIVVKVDGTPRRVTEGDVIQKNEIVITINQSSVLIDTSEYLVAQDQNCVGCGNEQGGWVTAPVSGELSVIQYNLRTQQQKRSISRRFKKRFSLALTQLNY